MKRLLILFLFLSPLVFAQGVRVDLPLRASGPNVPVHGGPLPQSLILANASVSICAHPAPSLSSCTPVTTYTDATLATPCPTNTPIVQLPGSACVATTGITGNMGFWYAGGTIDYFVNSPYGLLGPYTTSGGTTGPPGPAGPAGPAGPPGSGNITASPQFSLFYQPNSGTQSLAQGDANVTTDGSGNVTGVSLKAKAIGGTLYSAQYGTGLLGAMAANQTVITDPSDVTTSTGYNLSNPVPGLPNNFGWLDYRKNQQGVNEIWQNWGYTRNASYNFVPTGHAINCLTNQPYSGSSATAILYCLAVYHIDTAPGLNLGSSAVPAVGSTQWVVDDVGTLAILRKGGGVTQALSGAVIHTGDGDTAGSRVNTTSYGGEVDGSGEGNEPQVGGAIEGTAIFSGTCSTGCSFGSTQLKITASGCTYGNTFSGTYCSWGTGRPLVDVTQGPTANTVTNLAAGLGSFLEAVTVGTPITAASNAWGTLSGNCAPNGADLAHPPFYTSVTCNINVTSGTFVANAPMCFASQYWDVANVTAVSGAGPVAATMNIYKPHASGTVVMQGGPCGSGLEIVAETVGTNSYLGYIVGATTTSILQVTWYKQTGPSTLPFTAGMYTSAYLYGSAAITGISSSGTAVYFTGATGGTLPFNSSNGLNKQGIIFSAASDSAFNGTVCTNVQWLSSTAGTCTMAGLTGVHSATTATYILASGAGAPIANINIWPLAHVLDVQNEALTPPAEDGTVTLMTNTVNWTNGDTVREFNHSSIQLTAGKFIVSAQNPHGLTHALSASIGGLAGTGGGASTTTTSTIVTSNSNADTACLDGGGLYTCANLWNNSGPYNIGINNAEAPTNGQDYIRISPTTTFQRVNPNYNYNFLNSLDSGAGSQINIEPFFGDMNLVTRGQLALGGTGANVHFLSNSDAITMNDKLSFSALATPAPPTCVQGPGAGSLADGTYYYTLGIRNSSGFVVPSTETSVTVASSPANNNSVKCTWTRVKGVDVAYQLYGRSTGAELLMPGSSGNLFYVDDGSQTPSGAMPTVNTTLGIIDQTAQVGFNSLGATGPTAFETIVKSPASMAANTTVTLPAVTGTLQVLIASGTATMTTALITGPACGTTVTPSATSGTLANVATTDNIKWSFNAAPDGTQTGLTPWVTSGHVNFAYCLPTGASQTPTAMTINWSVSR